MHGGGAGVSDRHAVLECIRVKIRTAVSFFERLRGWWPRPRPDDADVLRFVSCKSVHTFGMREAIDVVFIDNTGHVLQVCSHVSPWRVLIHRRAAEVWELRAGEAIKHGLLPGRLAMRRQAGAGTVEVLLALVLVIWPFSSGLLEYSQLAVARQGLEYAVSEVARAVERTDSAPAMSHLRRILAHHLLPAFAPRAIDTGGEFDTLRTVGDAQMMALRPDQLAIRLQHLRTVGQAMALGAHEIRVEARWCRQMFFAPARQFIGVLAAWSVTDVFDVACLASGGFPLRAEAYAWRPVSRPMRLEP